MKTLLVGNKLQENLKEASLWVDEKDENRIAEKGREALEYLDQVVMYYDPMSLKNEPSEEYLNFVQKAIGRAEGLMGEVLECFDKTEIDNARQQMSMEFVGQ